MNWGLMSARGMGFPAGAVVKKRLPNKKARSQEDILEEETATHSSILAWRTPMARVAWWATVHGVAKNQTGLNN